MAKTNLGKVSLTPKGQYNATTQYERLDIVQYEGNSYIVLLPTLGVTPTVSANYMLMARKGAKGDTGTPFTYADLTPEQKDELMSRVVIDDTLTAEGRAADAKVVGGAIDNLHNTSGNSIKANANGKIIQVDDVSPIPHTVKGKVSAVNLFNITNIAQQHHSKLEENNTIHLPINSSRMLYTNTNLSVFAPHLKVGDTVVFTAETNAPAGGEFFYAARQYDWGVPFTVTQADLDSMLTFYKGNTSIEDYSSIDVTISNICLTLINNRPSTFIPYVDVADVNLESRGKNLVNIKDLSFGANGYSQGLYYANIEGGYDAINKLPKNALYTLHCDIETDGGFWVEGQSEGLFFYIQYTDGTQKSFPHCVNEDIFNGGKTIDRIFLYGSNAEHGATYNKFKNFILCFGSDYTYEPYNTQSGSYTPNAEGAFEIPSVSPTMCVFTNNPNVNTALEYNQDNNKVLKETKGAIISVNSPKSKSFTNIINDCQNVNDWTITNTKSLASVDKTNYITGTQSLHSNCKMQCTKNTYDLTKNDLVLKYKINSITADAVLFIELANSDNPLNRVQYTLNKGPSDARGMSDWIEVVIPYNGYSAGNVECVDFSRIDSFCMRALSTGTIDWNLQYVGLKPKAEGRGVVTFSFDDGYTSQYTGIKILAEKGISSTLFHIKEATDSGKSEYLSVTDLQNLVNHYGTDIEVHGASNYSNWEAQALLNHWEESKAWLKQNGLGEGNHMAYPGGAYTDDIIQRAKSYFKSCRTIDALIPLESTKLSNKYLIRAVSSVGGGVKVAQIKALIDRANASGSWLNLVFHLIGDKANDGMYCSEADLKEIADYAISSGITIMNYAEAVESL